MAKTKTSVRGVQNKKLTDSPFLFIFHVANATTEMERSGIEVRAAHCARLLQ